MGFLKKFAFGTILSSSSLMTYWYYYPREFYQHYKLIKTSIHSVTNKKVENKRPPPTPY